MNEKLKKALRVYEIVSVCIVTLLIIAILLIWINFGRVAKFTIKKALDNYNTEITEIISDFLAASGNSMGIKAIQVTKQDGFDVLRFEFEFYSKDLESAGISSFPDKSSKEIISELGITPDQIPNEIKSLVQSTRLAVDIYIYDENDDLAFSRLIMPDEIADFLKT